MSDYIWKTETCDMIPHQSSICSMRSIAVAVWSIIAIVSSAGNCIPTEKPLNQTYISVDSYRPSFSMQSKEGICLFSTSSNYSKIPDSLKRLDEISRLTDNWDGEGATSFSASIIETVKELIASVSVQPDIFPTLRNSIQLEYENDKNEYLEFELYDRDHINCYFNDHKGRSIIRKAVMTEINSIVNTFYE